MPNVICPLKVGKQSGKEINETEDTLEKWWFVYIYLYINILINIKDLLNHIWLE